MEHYHPEVFLGSQHHSRDKATHPAGVAYEFAAMIVAQSPAQRVIGEVRFQASQSRGRILDGQDRLRRPHLFGTLLSE